MEAHYLHSSDPRIRRWSAGAYSVASAAAGVVWAAAGLDELRAGRLIGAIAALLPALLVWFVVAGIGLRMVRWRERTSRPESKPARGSVRGT
jgi:hypothetical protein